MFICNIGEDLRLLISERLENSFKCEIERMYSIQVPVEHGKWVLEESTKCRPAAVSQALVQVVLKCACTCLPVEYQIGACHSVLEWRLLL